MLITPSSIPPAQPGDDDAIGGAGLAGRVLCGPGLWLDWLEKLQRASLLEELLADDVIARALEEAAHRHAYDRGGRATTERPVALAGLHRSF